MIINGFVLGPSKELLPDYKISPFSTTDLILNKQIPESDLCDDYFKDRFKNLNYCYTLSGRQAINSALSYYSLNKNDCVTILTTSGNFYISDCVTKEIERFCNWSRKFESNTKIILVNHEFGYPFRDILRLKEFNLPIIEDCAHSFFSIDNENTISTVGDFTIYSFPKIFPIQIGGLLVYKPSIPFEIKSFMDVTDRKYIKKVISHYIINKDEIIKKRKHNYSFLKEKFGTIGLFEYFSLDDNIIPGVFMFRTNEHKINLPELKKYFLANGVQCSVFYGEEAFFIPIHQALTENDMLYFYEIIKSFIYRSDL